MPEKVPPTLPGLPGEVITKIVSELIEEDLAALHAVNKDLYGKTKYAYAKRYLTHVHVFLHPLSFEKLRVLSEDPFYAGHIQHITISTYTLRWKNDRRKETSAEPFEDEKYFILNSASQAITSALQKATALKSLTISDYSNGTTYWPSDMPELPAWGINDLNRLVTFRRGSGVVTECKNLEDMKAWAHRMQAFEACLIGVFDAKVAAGIDLRMVLEGNAPRALSPKAQSLFPRALASAAHISTNLDAYVETRENFEWFRKINPTTLNLDYEMLSWETPDWIPSLNLGNHYDHLTNLRIVNAKTKGKELDDFLGAHMKTLSSVELKNICLLWPNPTDYPWKAIFVTLSKMKELQYLYLTTLSAFPLEHVETRIDVRAYQEIGWKTRAHVKCGLEVLCTYYHTQGASGYFVDMDYVEERLMVDHGITI